MEMSGCELGVLVLTRVRLGKGTGTAAAAGGSRAGGRYRWFGSERETPDAPA
jgi:hypothetical protein